MRKINYEYAFKRILYSLPTLFIVTVFVFLLVHMMPGSPARSILGIQATPERVAEVERQLGLNQPLYLQYFDWLGNALQGDLGISYQRDEPVTTVLAERLGITLQLILWTFVMTVLVAVPIGILSAIKKGSVFDSSMVVSSTFGVSIPELVSGVFLVLIFAVQLNWFPTSQYVSPTESLVGYARHMALPVLTLAIPSVSIVLRMTRNSFWDTFQADFVRFYRANGLAQTKIYRHVFKKSLIPVITMAGIQFGYMMAGAVVVEELFAIPGIGEALISSTQSRDIQLVQGTVLVIALWFILVNLVTDLLIEHVDPRIDQQ